MILTYFAYQTGFIIPAWIVVSAQLPMGFSNYLTTLRWQNFVWDYILILPAMLIYYPFFKVMDRQFLAEEEKPEQDLKDDLDDISLDDLSFDDL